MQQDELAHGLFLDIAGSSSLPVSQQRVLLENLQEFVHRTREFGRERAKDQITVVPSGGGMALVFFGDPEAPLRCAVEISRWARKTNKFRLRMGLHSWSACRLDDLSLQRKVRDGGIHVAQIVTDCGDQGHILASGFVADMLSGWRDALHDLGEVEDNQGVRLRLFNFWNSDAGNPEVPRRLASSDSTGSIKDQLADAVINKTISHYRVVGKLGSGGMGVVYEAEDIRLGRHVAIKLLSENFSKNSAAIGRFRREACMASSLNHANICTVHDVGEHAGSHFIVMELLEGKNLGQTILSAPLPAEQMVAFGIQIADGLAAAHKRAIVHRDIKPANLFVIERERIKILDFGLAKLTGRDRSERAPFGAPTGSSPSQIAAASTVRAAEEQHLTSPGAMLGTVAYMSPEQARAEQLDARTDLFSFGAVLYEMATGQLPFRGDSTATIFEAILNRAPLAPVRLNPDLPLELERIINKALEKNRDLRYQHALEMQADLRRLKRDMESGSGVAETAVLPAGKDPFWPF
jgi:serine/threonine protein kinase